MSKLTTAVDELLKQGNIIRVTMLMGCQLQLLDCSNSIRKNRVVRLLHGYHSDVLLNRFCQQANLTRLHDGLKLEHVPCTVAALGESREILDDIALVTKPFILQEGVPFGLDDTQKSLQSSLCLGFHGTNRLGAQQIMRYGFDLFHSKRGVYGT